MNYIDNFLNNITMYRLVLYFLILVIVVGIFYTIFGFLPFSPLSLIVSTSVLVLFCWVFNKLFARIFKVQTNAESALISALILSCLIAPTLSWKGFAFLLAASFLAMASKYIITLNKKHVFNPAAFAVVFTAFSIGQVASWWVGTLYMIPILWIGGLLIVRKLRRYELVIYFLITTTLTTFVSSALNRVDPMENITHLFIDSQMPFFAFVMLTEPVTSPPTKKLQAIYGGLVGILASFPVSFGNFYFSPELALLVGNIFSFLVSPKFRLLATLKQKNDLSPDILEFVFKTEKKLNYQPGQYMEWTLGLKNPDTRGNRRYFTLASSPTEDNLKLGVKINQNPSSFKKMMVDLKSSDKLLAGQLAGDFTLPKDKNKKLVFIAGGIGVTPFRSMVKYLLDIGEARDIILFYSNKLEQDIVYKEIFDLAEKKLGIKLIYILTDQSNLPKNWHGKTGYIDEEMIKKEVTDFRERIFYLSGPQTMVDSYKNILEKIGIPRRQIRTDYFPGY
jgi:glycine betaine catabolism B